MKGAFLLKENDQLVPKNGPVALCRCGHSAKKPYCDGSHKGTGLGPLKFTADAEKTVYLCGCKATKNAPFCDGGHSRL